MLLVQYGRCRILLHADLVCATDRGPSTLAIDVNRAIVDRTAAAAAAVAIDNRITCCSGWVASSRAKSVPRHIVADRYTLSQFVTMNNSDLS